jgi:proteasome alpha subunit
MPLPYYVSPEQQMKDKGDYARKGIARGKSVIALEYKDGIVFIAENPSATLHKISEIYDRIAFAGVGKFNEFEQLRIGGIRIVDVKGYSYSREDVSAKGLANAYSQTLGNIFSSPEMKPHECEILVAAVDDDAEHNELFHILFDGSVSDRKGWVAMGGQSDALGTYLESNYSATPELGAAVKLGHDALKEVEGREITADNLEIAVLDRTRGRRKFRRLSDSEVSGYL